MNCSVRKSTITGLADLNMDGTLEPFESEESPGLLDSFIMDSLALCYMS